jgi:hypothetical protein
MTRCLLPLADDLKLTGNFQVQLDDPLIKFALAAILARTGEIKVFLRLAENLGELGVGIPSSGGRVILRPF